MESNIFSILAGLAPAPIAQLSSIGVNLILSVTAEKTGRNKVYVDKKSPSTGRLIIKKLL